MLKLSHCLCVLCLVTSAFAQSGKSFVGTWKLDTSQSDFGSEPPSKSGTVKILTDSPQILSYQGKFIAQDGTVMTLSWSGPEDGSKREISRDGKKTSVKQGITRENGTLVRQGEDEDGAFKSRLTLSSEGNTLTDELTSKSKDGKESRAKHVYQRVEKAATQ